MLEGISLADVFDDCSSEHQRVHQWRSAWEWQVLGVAVIVPNAHFPGNFEHPSLVLFGDVLAGVMAVSLKGCIFDIEPLSVERHALYRCAAPPKAASFCITLARCGRGSWRAVAFLSLHPLENLTVCAIGGAMAMLIPAIGRGGFTAASPFAQQVLCVGAAGQLLCASMSKVRHVSRKVGVYVSCGLE